MNYIGYVSWFWTQRVFRLLTRHQHGRFCIGVVLLNLSYFFLLVVHFIELIIMFLISQSYNKQHVKPIIKDKSVV